MTYMSSHRQTKGFTDKEGIEILKYEIMKSVHFSPSFGKILHFFVLF